jgi:hypothetical protein
MGKRLDCRCGGGRGLLGEKRKLFNDVEASAAQKLQHDGAGEAGGVELDADLTGGFIDAEGADTVDLGEAADGDHGSFGGVLRVAEQDVQRHHSVLMIAVRGVWCYGAVVTRQVDAGGLRLEGGYARADTGWRLLKSAEVAFDFGTGPVLGADELAADDAVGVNDERFRGHGGAVGGVGEPGGVECGGDGEGVALEEGAVGGGVLVKGDSEDADAGHLLLKGDEGGKLFKAGGAPGGPEVEDDHVAAVGGEGVRGEVERGGGFAEEAEGRVAGVAAGECGEREQGESEEAAHATSIEVWA